MARDITAIINEIQEYIEECKPVAFSSNKIAVPKDELDSLLDELKERTPVEIRRYQKMLGQQEAIMADARNRAEAIVAQAQITTNELISEHQIMQQAYYKANEVIQLATNQAQEILDNASREANEMKLGAVAYTDELLKSVETIIAGSMETTRTRTESFLGNMQDYLTMVQSNRAELAPPEEKPKAAHSSAKVEDDLPEISVPDDFFNSK